ncbi:tetratricopeptide repeat protein [Patescibacteria group bacterium]|nr:tetratricopeptide repeat protein [Patescibacteria group bacterium]
MEPTNQNPNSNTGFSPENNKKNILLWFLVIFAALAVVFFSASYVKKFVEKDKAIKQKVTQEAKTFLGIKCDFANDEAAIQKAKEDKSVAACECIQDEQVKFRCQENAQNAAYFAQARAQFKADFCALIKNNDSLKSSCEAMVSSGIEYLKKEDPEYLASVYSQNNDYDRAIEILASFEKTKTNIAPMLSLALNYADKGLTEHKENEFFPKAEALVNKALALDSNSAEAYRVQGYIYEVKPDLLKSVESYSKSLEKDSNYVLSLAGRGHAYNLMGDLYKALEDFQKAAELDKDKIHMFIYVNLCRLQTSRDDLLVDGIKNCQIVATSNTAGAELKSDTYQILANAYVREKKFDEALVYLENARTFSPQNVNLFVSLANLYNEKEDYTKAIEEAQKALASDSLKTVAYQALAYAYLKTQDYAQAEKQALKGLEVVKNDPSLLVSSKAYFIQQLNYSLADVYTAQGNQEKEAQYRAAGDSAMKTQ